MMAAGRNGTIDELAAAGKIRGKQRHRLADTQGLPQHAVIQAVDSQDRDRGVLVMGALEHAAFTCVHAARSSICWIARFSAFGDSASTHPALFGWSPFRQRQLSQCQQRPCT
jgi:hypothetical protein